MHVVDDVGHDVIIGPNKQRELLAVLICRAGRPVTTGALVSGLWDGAPTLRAGDGLRVGPCVGFIDLPLSLVEMAVRASLCRAGGVGFLSSR
jgi:hypothetical protein